MTATVPIRLTRDQVLRTIAAMSAAGGQSAEAIPLFRATLTGLRLVRVIERAEPLPKRLLKGSRPTILTLGDDDYRSTGPGPWRCVGAAVRWASSIMVYAGSAKAQIYEEAVRAAKITGRLLLIETTADQVTAWHALIPKNKPALIVTPRPGAAPAQEAVH